MFLDFLQEKNQLLQILKQNSFSLSSFTPEGKIEIKLSRKTQKL